LTGENKLENDALKFVPLPASDDIPVDLMDPGLSCFHGAFRQEWETGGCRRSMVCYLPEGFRQNNRCIIAIPPSRTDPLLFLQESGLRTLADRQKLLICLPEPKTAGWQYDGADADFMNAAYKKVQSREYYVVMQDCIYAMGFGDGTVIALQAVMKLASEWSGAAIFGQPSQEVFAAGEASDELGIGVQSEELFISGQHAQLPIWFFPDCETETLQKITAYWRRENQDQEKPLFDEWGTQIFLPVPVRDTSKINDDNIAQVRISIGLTNKLPLAECVEYSWKYIGAARRHRSYGGKILRYYRDPLLHGAVYHTMKVDGMQREWYEYVPSCCRSSAAVPLVVVFHGRGGNAETFFDITDMSLEAEERGFIAVFPTADIYQIRKGGFRGVRLWNGSYDGKDCDSLPFIRKMIADVQARHSVDNGRIYACGQSSGGAMTMYCALAASDLFCAAAPWSGVCFPGGFMMSYKTDNLPLKAAVPIQLIVGKQDVFLGQESLQPLPEEGELAKFVRFILNEYDLKTEPVRYRCKPIDYYIWSDGQGIPLLTIGLVDDMPHANFPEECRIAYDQFFAEYFMDHEGNRYYLGRRINPINGCR